MHHLLLQRHHLHHTPSLQLRELNMSSRATGRQVAVAFWSNLAVSWLCPAGGLLQQHRRPVLHPHCLLLPHSSSSHSSSSVQAQLGLLRPLHLKHPRHPLLHGHRQQEPALQLGLGVALGSKEAGVQLMVLMHLAAATVVQQAGVLLLLQRRLQLQLHVQLQRLWQGPLGDLLGQ